MGVDDVVGALHVAGNELGEKGGSEVARALMTNTTLTDLHLARESVGDGWWGVCGKGGEEEGREGLMGVYGGGYGGGGICDVSEGVRGSGSQVRVAGRWMRRKGRRAIDLQSMK